MLKTYGIRETTVVATEAERHAEEIRIDGFTVVRQLAELEFVQTARARLDDAYARQAAEVGGEDHLRKINEANLVRCVLVHDPFFIDLATRPRILALLTALLGEHFILQQQNGVINPPGDHNHQASWHRDLPHQHFVVSRPLALSVLWCLDPFNDETGGTWILPASHKTERFPSEEYVAAHARGIVAEAGDALVFDSMLYHRAGNNRSGKPRRGVNHVYALPFLKQQISLPRALQGLSIEDQLLRRLLGFDSEPSDSTLEWRRRRLEKAG
jgi:ectoine hydroxylase-related dioxygenase (phytanoyl-CoA dioxygenase family)